MDVYIYQADIYCAEHGENIIDAIRHDLAVSTELLDSDSYPQGPFPDGGGEADSPQHCSSCGLFLENPLTDDGRIFTQKRIGRVVDFVGADIKKWPKDFQKWANFYAIKPVGTPTIAP